MTNNYGQHLLVCYDIADPRRLQKVHYRMKRWGAALQYSIFYCHLTRKQRKKLETELRSLINVRQDDVRIYGLKSPDQIQFFGDRPLYADILTARTDEEPSETGDNFDE